MTAIPGNGDRPDAYTVRRRVFDDEGRVRPEFKRRLTAQLRCARSDHLVGVVIRFPQWGTWMAVRDVGRGRDLIAGRLGHLVAGGGWHYGYWLGHGPTFEPCMCRCGKWTVDLIWLGAQRGEVLTSDMPVVLPWRDPPNE